MMDQAGVKLVRFFDLIAGAAINARAETDIGIEGLAQSIAEKGLIQPLAVRQAGDVYEVIDGNRRYRALGKLVAEGQMAAKDLIPVLVRNDDDTAALETSLLANTVRLPMHPVDQHEVFAQLVEQGIKECDIAARFGLAERTVKQHLALGRLAPVIRDAWRAGDIDTDDAKLFTIHPSHDVQTKAFAKLKKSNNLYSPAIRRELQGERKDVRRYADAILDLYMEKGGTITESLFDEDRLIDDPALLNQTVDEAIEAKCNELLADGWAWAVTVDECPYLRRQNWKRIDVEGEATEAECARLDEIENLLTCDEDGDGEDEGLSFDEEDRLEAERQQIEQAAKLRAYTAEDKARSGCVVELYEDDGTFEITAGIIKPDGQTDIEDAVAAAGDDDSVPSASETKDDGRMISGALLSDITEAQTRAVALCVQNEDPHIALCLAFAALNCCSWESPAKLEITNGALATARAGRNGGNFAKLFTGALAEDPLEVREAVAEIVASSLNLVAAHERTPRAAEIALINALDGEQYLRAMRDEFNATDYFSRAGKSHTIEVLKELEAGGVTGPLSSGLAKTKKAELAELAAKHAGACGWLPEVLRHPDYAISAPEKSEVAA